MRSILISIYNTKIVIKFVKLVLPITYPLRWFVYNHRKYIMPSYIAVRLKEIIVNKAYPDKVRRYHLQQPVHISPDQVVFKVHESYKLQYFRTGNKKLLIDGEWDVQGYDYSLLPTIRDIFICNEDYRNTDQYNRMIFNLDNKNYLKSYKATTMREVDEYFHSMSVLWKEIERGNFKTQLELGGWLENEVGVVIDRNGRIGMSHHGQHRVAMAKINQLTSIPVLILSVHKEWYKRCISDVHMSSVESVEQCIRKAIN